MSNPAYFVFEVTIHNRDAMAPYHERVADTYKPYGGQLLVLGGKTENVEGDGARGLVVILAFPSVEQANAWHASPEYQAIIGYRHAASVGHAYLVEGLPPVAAA